MRYESVLVPEWLRNSAIYQINLRTFSKEGTINSVIPELPFLKQLGFDILYLCPVYEADDSTDRSYWSERQIRFGTNNPNNPYRPKNYFKVDPEYGTMADLKNFVKEAHALGIKVLLDLVYLHMGPEAPILKSHKEFAQLDEQGKIKQNIYHFPGLDFNCQGLKEYLWSNMVYWLTEGDVDGFRCDVPDKIPNEFWMEGRKRIHAIKPDAVLINEGKLVERLASTFDACYGLKWGLEIHDVLGGEVSIEELKQHYNELAENTPKDGIIVRYMDNHDTVTNWGERSEVSFGHDGMEVVQVLHYMMDGVPMVYSGNELADEAKVNMFANRFHMGQYEVTDRSRKNTPEAIRRQALYKELNKMCKECAAITKGTMAWIENSQSDKVLSFLREYKGEKLLFIGNLKNESVEITAEPDWTIGNERMKHNCRCSENSICLEPYGYIVLEF